MLPLCSSLCFRFTCVRIYICWSHNLEKGITRLNEGETIRI